MFHPGTSLKNLAWCLVLQAVGCTIPETVPLEGGDRSVFTPFIRLTYDFVPQNEPVPEESDATGEAQSTKKVYLSKPVRGRMALEFEFAYASGDSKHAIGYNEMIMLDEVIFIGPDEIEAGYDLYSSSLVFRGGPVIEDILILEGLIGLGLERLDLDLVSGDRRESERITTAGFVAGARLTVRPLDWLEFYGQARSGISYPTVSDVFSLQTSLTSLELTIAVTPIDHMSLLAGYRNWRYQGETLGSEIDLTLAGPSLGVQIRF